MIVIVTGAPGAGKSLWTISEVEKLREESGRPVYYYNIPGVTVPWIELSDPKDVHNLPQGSIIVVDEAWQPYPNRPAGSGKPEYIEGFATHRHRGHDFYLMTQSTGQIDQFIRGMVGRHVHIERKFGLPRSRLWSWESRLGSPGDWHSRQEATASEFIFPKKFYGAYKSADMHTVKQRMPWFRLALLVVALVAVVGLVWTVFRSHEKNHKAATEAAAPGQATSTSPLSMPARKIDARRFSEQFEDVVDGQPYSATFYRKKITPATLPKIQGCLELITPTFKKCTCNTQQGTDITTMTPQQCHFYLRHGWFDFSKPDEDGEGGSKKGLSQTASNGGTLDPLGSDFGAAAPIQGPAGAGAAQRLGLPGM